MSYHTIPELLLNLLTNKNNLGYIPQDVIQSMTYQIAEETKRMRESELRKLSSKASTQTVGNRVLQTAYQYEPALIGKYFDDDRIRYWLMANLKDINYRPASCAENMARGHWFADDLNVAAFSEKMIARIRERFYNRHLSEINKKEMFFFVWRIYLEKRPGNADYNLFFGQ